MDVNSFEKYYSRRRLGVLSALLLVILGLYFIGGVGASNAPTEGQAVKYCENRCNEINEASGQRQESLKYQYCKNTFNIKTSPLSGTQKKEAETEYCTDGAKCPNLKTCEVSGEQTLDMEGCIAFMNKYHREQLGESSSTAQQHTEALLSPENEETGVGSCKPLPTWYTENFGESQ